MIPKSLALKSMFVRQVSWTHVRYVLTLSVNEFLHFFFSQRVISWCLIDLEESQSIDDDIIEDALIGKWLSCMLFTCISWNPSNWPLLFEVGHFFLIYIISWIAYNFIRVIKHYFKLTFSYYLVFKPTTPHGSTIEENLTIVNNTMSTYVRLLQNALSIENQLDEQNQ